MGIGLLRSGTRLILICGLLWCVIFGTSLSFAAMEGKPEENEVLAIGTGTIFGGNLASAKKSAISQALMKGVESYLVRRLESKNVVNNFERLIQEIIPKAEEDIENFNILAEYQIGDKYQVLIRLRINEKIIDKRLSEAGLTLTEGAPIKLLFMVSETKHGVSSYW
jgi:ribosomal protein S25